MIIKIRKYNAATDLKKLLEVIDAEGEEWATYLANGNRSRYQLALERSITYVAYHEDILCGFSRSISDFEFYIWVIDLLVHGTYRGHSIGKKLLDCIAVDSPDQEIYVMSDVDEFYHKAGYSKAGSIFKIDE